MLYLYQFVRELISDDYLIYLAPRAQVPHRSNFSCLCCQTGLKVGSDAKELFDALSNVPRANPIARGERESLLAQSSPN
jgi:hypothetical protein